LRNFDPQTGRFIQTDPYSQFPSGYTGMGNDPANNIDPSGGFTFDFGTLGNITGSVLGDRLLAAGAGALVGFGVDKLTGGNGWKGAAIGAGAGFGATFIPPIDFGNIGGGIFNQISNLSTHLPTVAGNILNVLDRPTTTQSNPSISNTTPNSLIRVYIKHGKKKADGGDNSWDKWDGHTLLQIDNMVYHFYPTPMRGNKNLEPNGYDNKAELKESWHSNGEVGTMDINDPITRSYFSAKENAKFGFSVFEIPITSIQKTTLLQSINNSIASPPDYRTLGTRCQSWCSGMLRNSNILPNNLKQYSWSTVPFSKALFRKLPKGSLIYKTFSSKTP